MVKRRLPAKSNSKGVQKQHTRRVMTADGPRDIIINPGNEPSSQKLPRNPVRIESRTGLARNSGDSLPARNLPSKHLQLRPRERPEDKLDREMRESYAITMEFIRENIGTDEMVEYPLCFDLKKDFDTQENYVQYQMSWGGPSDEFRIYADRIEYWYLDWFTGASLIVPKSDEGLVREVAERYVEIRAKPGLEREMILELIDND